MALKPHSKQMASPAWKKPPKLRTHPSEYLPLLKPSVSEAEITAVTAVLKSGWWGLGPITKELEEEFARATGSRFAIAVNSATSALHLAVKILKGDLRGGNIITTPLTFVSTAAVAEYENLEVRFADIDEKTLCLDKDAVDKLVDDETIAVIPVHFAGTTASTDYATPVIEDCAHAAISPKVGRSGIMSCWSFHPVKNIATGDGGMITTNDVNVANKLKQLRWMGISRDTWERDKKGYNWEYDIEELGYKYHANDIMSAIALTQLKRLKSMNEKRKKIAERYLRDLKDLPLTMPVKSETWHLFVVRMEAERRNEFIDYMRENKISVGVHYKPLHHYPIFKWKSPLPVTDIVFGEIVDLPIYPDLKLKEQNYIIKMVRDFFES